MTTCNKGYCFLVVHRHTAKTLSYIPCCCYRVWFAVRAFRVHINQAHLNRGQGILKVPFTCVALVTKPFTLGTPVNVFLWFPDILTSTAKTEGLKTHRFQSDITSENHQVGPGKFSTIFL